jgi:LysM repeat protein
MRYDHKQGKASAQENVEFFREIHGIYYTIYATEKSAESGKNNTPLKTAVHSRVSPVVIRVLLNYFRRNTWVSDHAFLSIADMIFQARYNNAMFLKRLVYRLIVFALVGGMFAVAFPTRAQERSSPADFQASQVTAYDLIVAMNTLRMSYGLPALIEHPIVNAVAQATANTMAANLLTWHIGDVRGRLAAAGYGGGGTVWGTENFAVGTTLTLDEIMVVWSDEAHMLPAVKPYYCHVGAGVATAANGMVYYVLQAAYVSGQPCGNPSTPGTTPVASTPVSGIWVPGQLISPVKVATPDEDGNVYHVVEMGQSLWAIAIAYQITINDIEVWNNISRTTPLRTGQRLLIPGKTTIGYATPTPKWMIVPSTPDTDGKIVHVVQPYQTLSTISIAYAVTIEKILALNNLKIDWPLSIGQELVIDPGNITPSPTPRPLTPIEKLTPASDGNYYHTVKGGETLSWIADLYKVPLAELMAWNNLTLSSIITVNQQLLLKVTPPVMPSATPEPPTATATLTPAPPTATPTQRATATKLAITPTSTPTPAVAASTPIWVLGGVFLAIGLLLWFSLARRRTAAAQAGDEPGTPE